MKVTIWGPNLRGEDQRKGTLHAHAADCADNGKMERKYGGSRGEGSWTITAESVLDVTFAIYSDHMGDHTEEEQREPGFLDVYVQDIHFAPCLKTLPYGEVPPEFRPLEDADEPNFTVPAEPTSKTLEQVYEEFTVQDAMNLLGKFA